MLAFLPAGDGDLEELIRTSKAAYENDVKYGSPEPGGPSGYDSVPWLRRVALWGARVYKVVVDGMIVGGIVVRPDPRHDPKCWYLERVWLLPAWQDCGIGTQAMAFAESTVPGAGVWKLDTPAYNQRNRHFYEKLGYKRVAIRAGMVLYDKRVCADGDGSARASRQLQRMVARTHAHG